MYKGITACKLSGKSCALLYKYVQEITCNPFHTLSFLFRILISQEVPKKPWGDYSLFFSS